MIPKVMASCCRPTRDPLTSGGAICNMLSISIHGASPSRSIAHFGGFGELTSALYIGTVILKEPTPIPVMNRPPRMYLSPPTIEQHCTITPMQKIITLTKIVYFRDILSAKTPE